MAELGFAQPAAFAYEFAAKVREVRNRTSERSETELEKNGSDFSRISRSPLAHCARLGWIQVSSIIGKRFYEWYRVVPLENNLIEAATGKSPDMARMRPAGWPRYARSAPLAV